jgi:hypothetical protein
MAKTTIEQYAAARPNALGRTMAAAPSSTGAVQTKAQREAADRAAELGKARRLGKVSAAKQFEFQQKASAEAKVPSVAAVAAAGGGIGGYLRAWRELNQ